MKRHRRIAVVFAGCAAVAVAAGAQVPNWPSERPPRPLAARDVKFPPYEIRTLSNGLQVIAVFHHEQPAVSVRLIVRAGGAQDPAAKPGVAYLAASLLDQGTATKSAEQIANTIDSIGGALGSGAGTDLTFINAAVMRDDLNRGLDLVSEIARTPAFAQDEIERQRQQVLSGLKVSYDDPDYLAGVVFDRLVFGFNPYGRPGTGTPETLASITRDDLVAFHTRWFGANNAILAIVGDTTPDEAFAGAERAFGTWARVEVADMKPLDPPPPTRRVVIVDRPGAVQTEIRVGNIGLPRRHPDYLALDIAIKILGGEGGNRLHRVLRTERGLTYGASADVHALRESGDIVADTDTRSDTTAETLRLIVDEFWRLQRQRVQERELSDSQAYLTGSFPLTIETPSAIALQVLNAVFYGLDLNELQTYRARVNAVTADDIQRVAQQYLRPDRLTIVLVGDAKVFAKQLAGVGFDQIERIPIDQLDLSAPDLRRRPAPAGRLQPVSYQVPSAATPSAATPSAATPSAATPSAATPSAAKPPAPKIDPLRELITRAVRAKGGISLLRSIKTVRAMAITTVDMGGQKIEIPTRMAIQYPGSYRMDARTPAGDLVQVFDRGRYWVKDASGVEEAGADVADELRASIQRDTIPLLLALYDRKTPARLLPTVTEEGRTLVPITVTLPNAPAVTLFFESGTALLVTMRYQAPAQPSGMGWVEETFSDYRDVKGLQVAYKSTVRRERGPNVERALGAFEFNVTLDPATFTKPS
jgi:zinc protease